MVDQLYSIAADGNGPAGVLRAYGSGGWRFYQDSGGGSYQSPPGDNGTLAAAGGAWTYSGNALATMTAVDGAVSTFSYTGGLLSGISTAGPRSWTIGQTGTDLS